MIRVNNLIGRPAGRPRSLALVAALLLTAAACGSDSPAEPSPQPSQQLQSVDLTVGTGTTAVNGRLVTVDYTGWLYDQSRPDNKGTQFDSSLNAQPFSFFLGTGQVITGWDVGVAGMRVGGTRRLTIPPQLAYGAAGSAGVIPPNATLVFEVTLLAVQ